MVESLPRWNIVKPMNGHQLQQNRGNLSISVAKKNEVED